MSSRRTSFARSHATSSRGASGSGARGVTLHSIGHPAAVLTGTAAGPFGRTRSKDGRLYLGALELDVLLGDVRSLDEKRSMVEPVLAALMKFGVSATEAGERSRMRRSLFGVAAAGSDVDGLHDMLDECERHVAERQDLELLAVRRRIFGPED